MCTTTVKEMEYIPLIMPVICKVAMVDSVFRTRSLGTAAEGVRDQYADGKAAHVWEVFIGDKNSRTQHYRQFLVGLLRAKGCQTVLDVACGTG
jgi:glycine N-methyltransferase